MHCKNHKGLAISGSIIFLLIFLFISNSFQSCSLSANKSQDSHPEYFSPLYKKVDSISSQPNADQTMAYIDSAFHAFPNPGIVDKFQWYDCIVKYWYYKRGNYPKAVVYTDSMISLVENKTSEEKYAQMYVQAVFKKGDCYLRMKLYDDAFHYYYLGEETVHAKIKDKCQNTEFDSYIPYLLYAQNKYVLAAEYFRKEYNQQSQCSDYNFDRLVVLQRTLNNIGLCYYNVGMLDSAAF